MARSPRVALLGATILLCIVSMAHAGTYDVSACDAAGGPNNSWAAISGNSTTAYTECPTGGDPGRGMIARNVVVPGGGASGNVVAQMKFTAPPGTAIVAVNAAYDFYRADSNWEAALSTGAQLLRGCPAGPPAGACTFSSTGGWIDVPGGSSVLYIDAYCATSTCLLDAGDATHGYVSARARLASAIVRLQDDSAPTLNSVGGTLWSDGWKTGTQTITVDASDNSGIRQTAVLIDGHMVGQNPHACEATLPIPCQNGVDTYPFNTAGFSDGPHTLTVQAIDSAGNPTSTSRTVLIDNSPPGPPKRLTLDGGEGWRPRNAFSLHWINPDSSGAPLAGVQWQLCPPARTTGCVTGSRDGGSVATINAMTVPKDGDWTLKLWARDAAGNNTPDNAADIVHLRVDSEAPTAVFSPHNANDPTTVVIQASDATSGVASGSIDFKPHDATDWTSLPARVEGGRLIATLPDETMADGLYDLRGRAVDQAGNERSTATLADATPMTTTLPLRSPTRLIAGRRQTRRHKGRRSTYLATRVRLAYGRRSRLQGRLSDKDNRSMADTPVTVSELVDVAGATWQPARTTSTDRDGRFRFRTAKRGASRTVRIRYGGTPTVRPVQADVHLAVAAASTMRASRRRVRAGRAVRFSGALRGGHVPPGKLVQLQVRLHGRWQTFANPHAKADGSWTYVYKFSGSYRSARYAFRARIPSQSNYPFMTGHTAATTVRVRGR